VFLGVPVGTVRKKGGTKVGTEPPRKKNTGWRNNPKPKKKKTRTNFKKKKNKYNATIILKKKLEDKKGWKNLRQRRRCAGVVKLGVFHKTW